MFKNSKQRPGRKTENKVFFVLTLILVFAFASIYFFSYLSGKSGFFDHQQQQGAHLLSALDLLTDNAEKNMRQLAWSFASLPKVAEKLLQAKRLVDDPEKGEQLAATRADLLAQLRPLQRHLSEEFDLRHLHFYLSPGNLPFLDVGRLQQMQAGSEDGCSVVRDAAQRMTQVSGFEICLDSVAIRSALPLTYSTEQGAPSEYAGILEVGTSLEKAIAPIRSQFGVDLAVILRKERIDERLDPQLVRQLSGMLGLEEFYVDATEHKNVLGRIGPELSGNPPWYPDVRLVPTGGETVAVTLFPVHGYGDAGKQVRKSSGAVLAWWDVTGELEGLNAQLKQLAMLFIAHFLVLDGLLYLGIRRLRHRFELMVRRYVDRQEHTERLLDDEITGHRKTREQLVTSQVGLQDILDNTPAVIFIKDIHGYYLLINKLFEELFGVQRHQIIGMSDKDVFPSDIANVFRANDRQVIDTGRAMEFEEHAPLANGDHIYLSVKFPLKDIDGSCYAVCGIASDITENKHHQEFLQKSESRLMLAQRIAHLGNWDWDIVSDRMHWSDEVYRIFGLERSSFAATYKAFLAIVHPDDRESAEGKIKEAIRKQEPYSADIRIVRPDGTIRVVHGQAEVFFGANGRPLSMSGTIQDITERKQAEQFLAESEERLRTLIEASPDVVLFKDGEGRWLSCNETSRKLFSLEGVDYLHKTDSELAELTLPCYREALLYCESSDELAWQATGVSRGEESIPTARGETRTFDVIKVPLFHSDGRRKGLVIIGRDITERKLAEEVLRAGHEVLELQVEEHRADIDALGESLQQGIVKLKQTEAQLRESQERFQQLANNTNDVFWITTPDFGEIIYMSPAFEKVWGLPIEELIANPQAWPEMALGSKCSDDLQIMSDPDWEGWVGEEHQIRRPDGSQRWISCRAFPVRDEAGRLYRIAGIAEDITTRKITEMERLAETRKQRDNLVREVHHRIKNHLQGIIGLLSDQIRQRPETGQALTTAIGQIGSIALVHGLQGKNLEGKVDLCSLAHSICQSVGGIAQAEIVLNKNLAPADAPELHPEEAVPISLVLNELLQNAVKHRRGDEKGAALSLELERSGDEVQFRIVNPSGTLPDGFDLDAGQGLGTGLGLVKSLMPRKGASLTIHQENDKVITELALRPPTISR